MSTYSIRMLKDENGIPFVPITHVSAVVGEEYTTSLMDVNFISNGHFQVLNDKLEESDIKGKIISLRFPNDIGTISATSYLKFNNGTEYPVYDYTGSTPLSFSGINNATCFFILNESSWSLLKLTTTSSGSGHVISDGNDTLMTPRGILKFEGLSVSDDSVTGSTKVSLPSPINNLTTSESGQGSLDAYQGYVLNNNFNNYIPLTGGTINGDLTNSSSSAFVGHLRGDLESKNGRITDANTSHYYDNSKVHVELLHASALMTSNKPAGEGYILDFHWDNINDARGQLSINNGANGLGSNRLLEMRFKNTSTWTGWMSVGLTAYPVGAIYQSTVSTSPATLFGGTWVQLTDRMLIGASGTYAAGTTGGETTHTLTVDELAKHRHGQQVTLDTSTGAGNIRATVVGGGGVWAEYDTNQIKDAGGNQAHNNMPPYRAVYMWYRSV